MAADRFSSQLVSSWPTTELALEPQEFREAYCRYLGAESPACRALAGRSIPVAAGDGVTLCDRHGLTLSRCSLPVESFLGCHDALVDMCHHLCRESGVSDADIGERGRGPEHLFQSVLPVYVRVQGQPPPPRHAIVPDMVASVSMPRVDHARPAAGQARRRLQPQPERRLIWDVKTVFGGGGHYRTARARDDQSGAVASRAEQVQGEYRRHAEAIDTQLYAPFTPVRDRLESFGMVRSLVFGHYGEASADVHALVDAMAQRRARRSWRLMGARTEGEARGYMVAGLRRFVGVFAAREMARHLLHRVPLVGVPRAVLDARRAWHRDRQPPQGAVFQGHGRLAGQDFFAFQARVVARDALP